MAPKRWQTIWCSNAGDTAQPLSIIQPTAPVEFPGEKWVNQPLPYRPEMRQRLTSNKQACWLSYTSAEIKKHCNAKPKNQKFKMEIWFTDILINHVKNHVIIHRTNSTIGKESITWVLTIVFCVKSQEWFTKSILQCWCEQYISGELVGFCSSPLNAKLKKKLLKLIRIHKWYQIKKSCIIYGRMKKTVITDWHVYNYEVVHCKNVTQNRFNKQQI